MKRLFEDFPKINDWDRFIGAAIYFCVGLFAITYLVMAENGIGSLMQIDFFYNDPINDFGNSKRLIWCIAWSFIGFSFIAYRASKFKHEDNACRIYFGRYLVALIVISFGAFVLFHAFEETSNYLFYFASAPSCLTLGYLVDEVSESARKHARSFIKNRMNPEKDT